MRETQESISQWAEETFGSADSVIRIAVRANEEIAELLRALTVPDTETESILIEAADIAIVMCRVAAMLGVSIQPYFEREIDCGYPRTPFRHAVCVYRSMSSLLLALDNCSEGLMPLSDEGSRERAKEVACLCVSHLSSLVLAFGNAPIGVFIDEKMAINRKRKWRLDGTGHGYHVRDKETE